MPELPEVEVVRRGLEEFSHSWTVSVVRVLEPRSLKRHGGSPDHFVTSLEGATLRGAIRRGKFLWFPLAHDRESTPRALLVHLGMSGQLLVGDGLEQFGPLLRVAVGLSGPRGREVTIGFVDQRIFGSLAVDFLVETLDGAPAGHGGLGTLVPSQVAHIARDPLDPHLDEDRLISRLRAKKTGIKRALLNQELVSGVGNIYADEALWAAKLHYDYPAESLSLKRARELLGHIREVFGRALEHGGTSFDWQYVNVNGQSGYFSQSLNAYGQDGKPCPRCGSVIVREPFMNRSSFRCPRCQGLPRKRVG